MGRPSTGTRTPKPASDPYTGQVMRLHPGTSTARLLVLLASALLGCGDSGGLSGSGERPPPADAGRDATTRTDAGVPQGDAGPEDGGTPPPADGGDVPDGSGPEGDGGGSGGSGGAYPGPQTRTARAGGDSFSYALYIPSSYRPGTPMPLLCLFHGQGGSGAGIRDFWQATAEREGFLLMATDATGSSGGWYPARDAPRFEAALNDALAAYTVDTRRLYLWGFSAGAHFVHAIALLNPDLFAAYAVSAGVLGALAGSSAPAEAARLRRIPVEIRVGRSDPLFPQAQADRDAFLAAGWAEGETLRFTAFDGGHTLRSSDPPELWGFLSAFRLP